MKCLLRAKLTVNTFWVMLFFASNAYADLNKAAKGDYKRDFAKSTYIVNIPYQTATAALAALESRKDVQNQITSPLGWYSKENWRIFIERLSGTRGYVEWAFTQPGHAAYPSVIKRYFDIGTANHIYIESATVCNATLLACQELNALVSKVNWRIKKRNETHFITEGEMVWKDKPSLP